MGSETYHKGKRCKECGAPIPDQSRKMAYCHERCRRRWLGRMRMRKPSTLTHRQSKPFKDEAIELQGCKCVICGWFLAFLRNHGLHVHHIIPVSAGGTNEQENLVVLCPNCHAAAEAGFYTEEDLRAARLKAIRETKRNKRKQRLTEDAIRIAGGLRFLPPGKRVV